MLFCPPSLYYLVDYSSFKFQPTTFERVVDEIWKFLCQFLASFVAVSSQMRGFQIGLCFLMHCGNILLLIRRVEFFSNFKETLRNTFSIAFNIYTVSWLQMFYLKYYLFIYSIFVYTKIIATTINANFFNALYF